MSQLFSLGEVSQRLAVPTYRILYLLNSRLIEEPRRVAGRRVWTVAEIETIRQALRGPKAEEVCNGT
jgi:DNA-binding transcriptional MerR regulator